MTARNKIAVLRAPDQRVLWEAYQAAFLAWESNPTKENREARDRAFAAFEFAYQWRAA